MRKLVVVVSIGRKEGGSGQRWLSQGACRYTTNRVCMYCSIGRERERTPSLMDE